MRHHRTALSGPPLPRGLAPCPARPPGFALSRRGRWPLFVALPSSRRTSSTLRQRLHVLRYRCDDYLIKMSFSWLLRSSQGPFLSPIEFGSASSKVLRQCERDRCPKGSGPLVQLTKDILPPSETLWCALVQAPVWLCFRPWLFW